MTTDGKGLWIVVWSDGDIRVARSTDNGMTWSTLADLLVSGQLDIDPQIVTDGSGRWMCVWQSGDEVLAAVSLDDGISWNTPIQLSQPPESPEDFEAIVNSKPRLATNGQGLWITVWTHLAEPKFIKPPPDDLPIWRGTVHLSRSMDDGTSWSDPTELLEDFSSSNYRPDIASDGMNDWISVWVRDPLLSPSPFPAVQSLEVPVFE